MRLAFWPVPIDEDVERVAVLRSSAEAGPYEEIALLRARDGYGNWVTHFEDRAVTSGTVWYQVQYLKYSDPTETTLEMVEVSLPHVGEIPYAVTPKMVLDNIQGIDMARVEALAVQRTIGWIVADMEYQIRQALSVKTVIGELHGPEAFEKILGQKVGQAIQLRNLCVKEVTSVRYQVRGGVSPHEIEMTKLDLKILRSSSDEYNRGEISIWPTIVSLPSAFAGARFVGGRYQNIVNVLFDYMHGWTIWPPGLVQAVVQQTAAFIMEIAGEAGTAGISSRGIDGYSESYTASATTTIFSARRIFYLKELEETLKRYQKPLWG